MTQADLGFLDDLTLDMNKPRGPIKELPRLYTKSSTGATQLWTIEIDGDRYRTISGQEGGTMTTSSWTLCRGKNVGRANETSDEQQAMSEAKAKWKKKKEHGGSETKGAAGSILYISPMLAKTWQKLKKRPKFPVYVQYKFNGIRCIVNKDGMFTRKGKRIYSCPHIWEALEDLFITDPGLVLDGELYNHTMGEHLNRILKLVRKQKNISAETLAESKRCIKFYNYDGYNVAGLPITAPYLERKQALSNLLKHIPEVYIVETEEVNNETELDEHFERCKAKKYEGQMIRLNAGYKLGPGRSDSLIKRKDFLDDEYKVIGVNEGTGNDAGQAVTFTCVTDTGDTFNPSLTGPAPLMREIWNDPSPYIGKMATVKYQNLSEYGIPQFCTVDPTVMRDYE